MKLLLIVAFVVGCRFALFEYKLYKLRLEYVGLRVEKLREEKENALFFDSECLDEDFKLLQCECSKCEYGDSSAIGVVCCLDKPQFTDDGYCADFVEKV